MSRTNNNMQTQTSNALHNAIIEVGGSLRHSQATPVTPGNKGALTTKINGEVMETFATVPEDIQKWINAEAKVVQITLTGIDNDIYSTVDACPNAIEMWKQLKGLNKEGESLESYYSRFYKMMNELVRNQCIVTHHQVNVQFLLQLKPEWQSEVNEIRAKRLARTANPLALVAQQQPVYHPQHKSTYSTLKVHQPDHNTATRNEEKVIVNPPQPTYDPEPKCRTSNWRDDDTDENRRQGNIEAPDMSNNGEEADQDDQMLQKERELLVSLIIEQMKIRIDASKQNNKALESSNKALKEANTFLQSELTRYQDTDFVKNAREKCATAYGLLEEHKVKSEKSSSAYTEKILSLNKKISEMENELSAHKRTNYFTISFQKRNKKQVLSKNS
ncbi:hypothetical protein Tco_0761839 [Tanacetum coccineum]|uniref:Gag-Pol polyprotein n=1 Tax=Tanacetum coccineum TaxID=301880 RepID=A0ABQ5DC57_9ASTR